MSDQRKAGGHRTLWQTHAVKNIALFLCLVIGQFLNACGYGAVTTADGADTHHPVPEELMEAADNTWTWVPIDGAMCANGSATGIAVSPAPNSDKLLVFFEGGGACFSDETCRKMTISSYVQSGYTENTFETVVVERNLLEKGWLITSRGDPNNPFQHANMAYVPYCTGDVHAGDAVVTYPNAPAPTYHVGYRNTRLYFEALSRRFPTLQSVWLSGFSAGGFGAAFHRDTAQDAFTQATINIIDDSGLSYTDAPAHPTWNVHYPAGCPDCASDFSTIMEYYARTAPAGRFALLSYTVDAVLPLFFNQTSEVVAQDIANFKAHVAPLDNVKTFYVVGDDHVVMQNNYQTSEGVSFTAWLQQMVNGAPTWGQPPQ